MSIHFVNLALVQIAADGSVVNKNGAVANSPPATIGEMLRSSSEIRVLPDSAITNSAGFPTIKDYLDAEDGDGFTVSIINQTFIITSDSSGGGGGGGATTPSSNGVGSAVAKSVAVAVTTSGAYAAGDGVGGIISLLTVNYSSGRRVMLRSLQVSDKGNNSAALHIYFFKGTPSGGTYTDNAALVWGSGDSANKVGQVNIRAGDWLSDGSQASVSLGGVDEGLAVTATTLFMLIVCPTASAPTFTNGDLTLKLEFDQQ